MKPSLLAVVALAVYFALAFVARVVRHRRATGHTGLIGVSGARGSAEWWPGPLFGVASVVVAAGPILALAGVVRPLFGSPAVALTGLALAAIGTAGTVLAQSAMGASWRVGVRASERTLLVTTGLFAVVRNPIF